MAVKKRSRRLKRQVRKTLGALFLASAVAVAAIPTTSINGGNAAAADAGSGGVTITHKLDSVTISDATMKKYIPEITTSDTIYSSQNGDFQFAVVNSVTSKDQKVAVLVGYNRNQSLDGGVLTIPDTLDAYKTFNGQPTAVSKKTDYVLYYDTTVTESTPSGTDFVERKVRKMVPCYAADYDIWSKLDGKTRGLDNFYYRDPNVANGDVIDSYYLDSNITDFKGFIKTTDEDYQWLCNVVVQCVGNQYIDSDTGQLANAGGSKGVFAGAGNIVTLNVGKNLVGIGNSAFYGCTGLSTISFGNGLCVIGNSAFMGCTSLGTVNMPVASNIQEIGDHAFASCTRLTDITIPISVQEIGDSAFENCTVLSSVELCTAVDGDTSLDSNSLNKFGNDVFKNCRSLQNLMFPSNFAGTVDVSMFQGCYNLHYIGSRNTNFQLVADDGFTFDAFKEMLDVDPINGTFYLEGIARTECKLYQIAQDNCFAFRHIEYDANAKQWNELDEYELTVAEKDSSGNATGNTVTYLVNSSYELLNVAINEKNGHIETISFPDKIGPYGIHSIEAGVFKNQCFIKKIEIPATIQKIASNAFQGCHSLTDVIFASGDITIEANAFDTQNFDGMHKCTSGVENDSDGTPKNKLHFTGPISNDSAPFNYAMSENGLYSYGGQKDSYIIYYSGWPQNLQVEYVDGQATLTDFPNFSDLKSGKYSTSSYAYITKAYEDAAASAYSTHSNAPTTMTADEEAIYDAVKNLVIPEGVVAIEDGLYVEKEHLDTDKGYEDPKTVTINGMSVIETGDFTETVASVDDPTKTTVDGADKLEMVIINGDTSIEDYAFKDCEALTTVVMSQGNGTDVYTGIGTHAFEGCKNLTNVSIPANTSTLGVRPFAGCTSLKTINFQNSPYFTCTDSMIFGLTDGVKTSLVECLEGKTEKYIRDDELAGITSMYEEAFAGNQVVREVDLSTSLIKAVPKHAFMKTPELTQIKLPSTCTTLNEEVFKDSAVKYIEVPAVSIISATSFDGTLATQEADGSAKLDADGKPDNTDITLCVTEGSYMDEWGQLNNYDITYQALISYYTVVFWDWNAELGKNEIVKTEENVLQGTDATPPEPRGKDNLEFTGWDPDYHEVSGDLQCFAQYGYSESYGKIKVVFKDWDGTELKTAYVTEGEDASEYAPKNPTREGYMFIGWDRTLTDVTEEIVTQAQYELLSDQEFVVRYFDRDDNVIYTTKVKNGEQAPDIAGPAVSGSTFVGWRPTDKTVTKDTDFYAQYDVGNAVSSGSGTGTNGTGTNGTGTDGTSTSATATTYTLTVVNGSGSGSYIAGSQPIIVANDPASGMEFSSWTVSPSTTKIASTAISATVITMPSENVTVTANYKKKSGTSTVSGNGTSTNSGGTSGTVGTVKSSGTTVVIDKNGLSNTGVVSATVNGSSDNFTIKISESSTATESILKALMAEYGDDLSNIRYFPMDITLYDAAGTTKITDTTGLSVSITLPLPDSMITYAGNNKVAGVVNDKLDKLTPKFTTINGVSCVTFTAEHFSPYVIYVDISNLTAGTVSDATPKTGDGIHPKWFLSLGLACISFVLFMQKDSSTGKKKKVKVRAA